LAIIKEVASPPLKFLKGEIKWLTQVRFLEILVLMNKIYLIVQLYLLNVIVQPLLMV